MSVTIRGLGAVPPRNVFGTRICEVTPNADDVEMLLEQTALLLSALMVEGDDDTSAEALRLSRELQQAIRLQASREVKCNIVLRAHSKSINTDRPGTRAARRALEFLASQIGERLAATGAVSAIPGAAIVPFEERVVISRRQRRLHVIGEVLALTFAVPLMGYFAFNRRLPGWARAGAAAVGVGSLILDGFILFKFAQAERATRK